MKGTHRTIALVVFAAGISTCGGSGGSGMGFPQGSNATFQLSGSIPASGASGVPLGSPIQVRFEHPVSAASVTPASFSVWAAERVEGDLAVSGDTIVFTPHDALPLSAAHSVRLTTAIRSTAGESLAADVAIPFHTRDGNWGAAESLPSGAILADLAGTDAGEMVALRMRSSTPWSDLVVTRLSPATGTWMADTELFTDGSVAFARLALDGSGWGVAVANRNIAGNTYATWASLRASDGSWSTPAEATPLDSGFGQPRIALVRPGRAVLVWRRNATEEVWARTLDSVTGWSEARRLSTDGVAADAPSVVADGAGAALIVWREDTQRVHAVRLSGSDEWGPGGAGPTAELVHDAFTCCPSEPLGAVAPGAAPVVAWHDDGRVLVSRYQPGTGTWSSAEVVNSPGCAGTLEQPRVALDAEERAFASWRCGDSLWVSWAEPGLAWRAPVPLDATASAANTLLSVDANKNVTLLWTRHAAPGDPTSLLMARRLTSVGLWTGETQLSTGSVCAVAPRLVTLPSGELQAAWTFTVGCDFNQGAGSGTAAFREVRSQGNSTTVSPRGGYGVRATPPRFCPARVQQQLIPVQGQNRGGVALTPYPPRGETVVELP